MTGTSVDVTEEGVVGDGERVETDTLQRLLDAAAGGGTLRFPPGTYRTAPLSVGDDTTLQLESGATLAFIGDYTAFPTTESRWEGWDQYGFHPCLRVADARNVRIEGAGTIDGGGPHWWDLVAADPDDWPTALQDRVQTMHERNDKADDVSTFTLRPPLLQVYESENVTVEGITLQNSPFWNTHVVYSHDVTLTDLRIENPPDAPNGDGIDVDSSRHVRISDCFIDAGDDAICLKSGKDAEGRAVGRPTAQITVTNCTVESGHGGVVIGSEMSGDVRDVAVSNCTFTGTDRGIRIKTQRGRGGVVEDLRFDTLLMRDVVCPFVINGYYFMDIDSAPAPVDETTPMVRDVTIQHVTARHVASAAFLAGLPEQRFTNIVFDDVAIEATKPFDEADPDPSMAYAFQPTPGVFAKSLGDVTFRNVSIATRSGPAFVIEATDVVTFDGLDLHEDATAPAITLHDVDETVLDATSVPPGLRELVRVTGDSGEPRVRDQTLGLADRVTLVQSE